MCSKLGTTGRKAFREASTMPLLSLKCLMIGGGVTMQMPRMEMR